MSVFCERLKQLRNDAGLSQSELGKKLNCQRTRIADLERDKTNPSIEDLTLLCNIFDVSSDYLIGLSDVATTNVNIKAICEYTGLTEDSVYNLSVINDEKNDYKDSIFEFDQDSYELRQATLFFINCVLEDRSALNTMSINFYEYFKLLSDKNYDANTYSIADLFEEFQAEQQNKDNNMCVVPKSEMIDYKFYSFINQFSEMIKHRAKEASLFFEE